MRISRSELNHIILEELQTISEGWAKGWLGGKKKSKKLEDSERESEEKRKKAKKSLKKAQSSIDRLEKEFGDVKEATIGQLPYRYVELINKWLHMRDKHSSHNLNKLVNYLQGTESAMASKLLIKMAKELQQHKKIASSTVIPKEFTLSDQWQEVPKDTLMPPGAEYRMDLAAEKTYARFKK